MLICLTELIPLFLASLCLLLDLPTRRAELDILGRNHGHRNGILWLPSAPCSYELQLIWLPIAFLVECLSWVLLLRRELRVFGANDRKLSFAHLHTRLLSITHCGYHECTACHTLVNNPLRLVTAERVCVALRLCLLIIISLVRVTSRRWLLVDEMFAIGVWLLGRLHHFCLSISHDCFATLSLQLLVSSRSVLLCCAWPR